MKRLTALLLAFLTVFTLCACSGGDTDVESTTGTEEQEVFVTSTIIKDGASDYVIVHDGTTPTINLANELRNFISVQFGVAMEVVSGGSAQEKQNEIIIGNARPISEKTTKKLTGLFDFALKVEQDKLVLCAKDAVSYLYLTEYLKREVFLASEDKSLLLDSDDNIVYSQSALVEMNYIDYMQSEDKFYALEDLFAFGQFQNSDTILPYRIYIPFNYSPEKTYPLYINLHGAGSRGDDNQKQLGFIGPVLKMESVPLDDAIIIFPQCPLDNKWVDTNWEKGSYNLDNVPESNELKALVELIGQLQNDYSIDEKRIYGVGVSMGGYGVWNLMMNHPDLFAAGIMMCGAADPSKGGTIKDIPIWTIHGDQDPTVPVEGTRQMVDAIKAAGGEKIIYTELPGYGHDVWTYTYTNEEIFTWLFEQVKP